MSDRDLPRSVEECRATLKRHYQAREQSQKLQNHRIQLDDKIDELAHQIDADRKLFLKEHANEMGKLLGAKQSLMLKLKQTRLEVDHLLDAVEEMEERSGLVTERLVDLLLKDDPSAEANYNSLQAHKDDAKGAAQQLSALVQALASVLDRLRLADQTTHKATGIWRFLSLPRDPSPHLHQVQAAAAALTNFKIPEPWLSAADSAQLETIAQAISKQTDHQANFQIQQKACASLFLELEELYQKARQAQASAEQTASTAQEKLHLWLLGEGYSQAAGS